MITSSWPDLEKKYLMFNIKRPPMVIVKGEGVRLWDQTGRSYLDFVGGWAVNALGHCHPAVVNAIQQQAATLIHTSNQYYTIPQIELGRLLVENSALDKVFLCNSGAEANEGAVKLARKYGKVKKNGAYEVITTLKSFHGRTLAMVAATGKPHYQEPYQPLPVGFLNVPYNDLEVIKQATNERTIAIMIEPVQGEGGVNVATQEYMQGLRDWCDENGLLLMLDEVQTGIGRTGKLFAYQHYGIEPDVMTLAKALGGGVSIGALLSKQHCAVFEPGDHGSTFGGNPLACAAGVAVMNEVLQNNISGRAASIGEYLVNRLGELKEKYPLITEVRGLGLLCAFDINKEVAGDVMLRCSEESLLINMVSPTTIRLMPPLIITEDNVDEAIDILSEVLSEF
ncbi:aspartate aminotransferase family protein [Candidatus Chlorohelix sp.]|uniref:aspartate aminotransferase family protein n=1 Tax=Candidatus Chlorohelix sp. TaxID=3139201 RepID=UPI0031454B51